MNADPVAFDRLRVACSNCNLRELCLPMRMSRGEIEQLDHLVATRRKVVAFDIVELSPLPGIMAPNFLCAKLIYKMLTYQFARR